MKLMTKNQKIEKQMVILSTGQIYFSWKCLYLNFKHSFLKSDFFECRNWIKNNKILQVCFFIGIATLVLKL